jgi:hypothetical protein
MKSIIQRVIVIVSSLGLLKVAVDLGVWLMNVPNDITFFLGLLLILISSILAFLGINKALTKEFTTIKDLFTKK